MEDSRGRGLSAQDSLASAAPSDGVLGEDGLVDAVDAFESIRIDHDEASELMANNAALREAEGHGLDVDIRDDALSSARTAPSDQRLLLQQEAATSISSASGSAVLREGDGDDHVARLRLQAAMEERDWDGALLECWYKNTWTTFWVTALLPCVTFGNTLEAARLGSATRHALVFAAFFVAVETVTFFFQIFPFAPEPLPVLIFVAHNVVMWGAILAFTYWLAWWRGAVRRRLGIAGSLMEDMCVMWWCTPCSLCQQARSVAAHDGEGAGLELLVKPFALYPQPL